MKYVYIEHEFKKKNGDTAAMTAGKNEVCIE